MTAGWSVPTAEARCLVCGDGTDVRMGLMRFRQSQPYASGWRCRDHRACRDRFERDNPRERYPLEDPK